MAVGPIVVQTALVVAASAYALWRESGSIPSMLAIAVLVVAAATFVWAIVSSRGAGRRAPETHYAPRMETPAVDPGLLDSLTHLPTRLWYDHTIAAEVSRSARYRHPLSLLLIEVDRFPELVRAGGQGGADYVLLTLADSFRAITRQSDQVSRIAEHQFAVILPETDAAGAAFVGEKIRRSVELYPFDENFEITVSIGIAGRARDEEADELLLRAEAAAMEAHHRGGNACVTSNE